MKAKVIIENGLTTIVLTPENDFEKTVLDDAYKSKDKFLFEAEASAEYQSYGNNKNHKLVIWLKPKND